MLALIIPLIILGGIPFAIAVGLVSILAYKEFLEIKDNATKTPNLIKALGLISMLSIIFLTTNGYSIFLGISYSTLAISIMLIVVPSLFYKNEVYSLKRAFYLLGFVLLLGVFFNALILIREYSIQYFILLLIVIVMTDTFAMILGKLIGRHKMVPHISPNKTWEGAIVGCLMGTAISSIYYINIINGDINLFKICGILFALAVTAQMGDLIFSKIKRESDIKDFSDLIPGHGGVLDRIDSLVLVVIAFLIIITHI